MDPLYKTPAEERAFRELVAEYKGQPFDIRLIKLRAARYEIIVPPLPPLIIVPPLP